MTHRFLLHWIVVLGLSASSSTTQAFQVGQLLSTCIDACQRGCDEIRRIQQNNKDMDDLVLTNRKDPMDPRSILTKADNAAQAAIIGSLQAEWGDALQIVGEEDNVEIAGDYAPLCRDFLEDDLGEETMDIPPEDICIFVDPLDGTREFVQGRLENCQVLVGIAIGGEAVAGAVGIPFPFLDSEESTIIYGLADFGTGVRGAPLIRGPFPLERNIDGVKYPRPHHATGNGSVAVILQATEKLIQQFGGSNVIYGGAGNKILAASLGEVACSLQHRVGGPWDLCAPEAIAKAMGAGITDLFGDPIAIYQKDAPPRCNERGYLVSAPGSDHKAVVATVLCSDKVQEYRKSLEVSANVQ